MCQTIDDIVVIRLDFNETFAHTRGVVAIFRRARQAYCRGCGMLLDLQVIELEAVVEGAARVSDEVVLDYFRLGLRITGTGAAR